MDQSKNYEQSRYNPMEARNDGLGHASQRFLQDPLISINTNLRPLEFDVSGGTKPVLNYSIQTGEEFSLEFMRERVNHKNPLTPNTASEPSNISDVSVFTIVEKGHVKEFEKKGSSGNKNRVPRTLSRNGSNQGVVRGYSSLRASDSSLTKIKFLCSFGGKILPRPSDGKLRYVGGETRIIEIRKNISWQELMHKTMSIYNQAHAIKYQLPGEDLNALVSVSCNEDLKHMLEECVALQDGNRSQKLRMFLVSTSDLDDPHFGFGSMDGDSEIQYVVAVNGMDLGPKTDSIEWLASNSANDLDRLLSLNAERETNRVAPELAGTSAATLGGTLVPPLTVQYSKPILASSSSACGTHVLSDRGQIMHQVEAEHNPFSAAAASSVLSQYENNSHFSNCTPFEGSVPMLLHGHLTQGGLVEGFSEVPIKEFKLKVDGPGLQKSEFEQIRSLENEYHVSSKPCDGSIPNYIPAEGLLLVTSAPERGASLMTSTNKGKQPEPVQGSLPLDALNAGQICKSNDGYANSEADSTDFSYLEPPVLPHRVFHSERIPQKQAELELRDRLSKSDDSFGPQFLMSHSCSDLVPQDPISEIVDKSLEGNLASRTEPSISSAKLLPTNSPTIQEGLEPEKSNLDHAVMTPMCDKDTIHVDTVRQGIDACKTEDVDSNDSEKGANGNNMMRHANNFTCSGTSARDVSQEEFSLATKPKPEQGDIIIDNSDRFSHDFLSDIVSKASHIEGSSGTNPLYKDESGLSLNMENLESKNWSLFQKSAQDEFVKTDVSLMVQDHLGFSYPLNKFEERDSGAYHLTPLMADLVSLGPNSQIGFGEEIQKESPSNVVVDTVGSHLYYDPSQVKGREFAQLEGMPISKVEENLITPGSNYKDEKLENGNIGGPLIDSSVGDFDINTLQIIKNEDLEELKELGAGKYGTVYHGKWRGTDVAIKRIKKGCFTGQSSGQERLTQEFWREAEILSTLHHPNVVAFYGVVQDGPGGTLATLTEFMVNGSLRNVLIRKDRNLDRRKRLIIAMDAAFGMEYLHSKNIVHFDLKCDNLLVNLKDPQRPICKVGDFGLSKIKRNTLVTGGIRGTLPWMAPELLNGSTDKVSEKVDVFSFAIVLWEILTGEEPYANMHYGAIIGGIVNNTLRPPVPSFCDSKWRGLMEQCWASDPIDRPSFTEIAGRLRVMSASCQTKPQSYVKNKATK